MKLGQWFRESPSVAAATLALALAVGAQGFLWARLVRVTGQIQTHRERLGTMKTLAANYRALKAKAAARQLKPTEGDPKLTPPAVDRIARKQRISRNISDTSVSRVKRDDKIEESVINLSIKDITRQRLARFLLAAEGLGPGVRAKKLRMVVSAKNPKHVDAQVQLSSYEARTSTSK